MATKTTKKLKDAKVPKQTEKLLTKKTGKSKPAVKKTVKPIQVMETTRRDLVQTSLNERNTALDHADDRLFERIREVDPTVVNKR